MHPSATSSSDHHPSPAPVGLLRYGSAPGSFLSAIADSTITNFTSSRAEGGNSNSHPFTHARRSRFFSGESPSLTSESSCKATDVDVKFGSGNRVGDAGSLEIGLDRNYSPALGGFSMISLSMDGGGGGDVEPIGPYKSGGGSSALFRHSSSPAGFLSNLAVENGFTVGRNGGSYSFAGVEGMSNKRLKSQLSFTSRQDSISRTSKNMLANMGESPTVAHSSDEGTGQSSHPYMASSFKIGPWEEPNSIIFSTAGSKHNHEENEDILAALSSIDSQYGYPKTAMEMANVENLFQIQQDAVPCKVRAKRGCATHPRSIAERERRTRISEKLKNLQELVPNMDKQTSTADMLDLAVEYIKSLKSQVQKLNQDGSNCICRSKNKAS